MGSPEFKFIAVYNVVGADLIIGSVAQIDSVTSPFEIIADNCLGQDLAEAESCLMEVQFTPTSTALASDGFDLPSDDGNESVLTVRIQGQGALPGSSGNPDSGGGGCFMNTLSF